jgi:DNA-binding response OmpR family regulator
MPAHTGDCRILVVEDEKVVADSLAQILSVHDYVVRTAYSAEDAIDALSDWRPDLAILDVMLPKMNGIELAVVLKANYPDCRILLFSGQPSVDELLEKAKVEGHVFEILAKPVPPAFMLSRVSNLLLLN